MALSITPNSQSVSSGSKCLLVFLHEENFLVQARKSSASQLSSSQPDPTQGSWVLQRDANAGCVGLRQPSRRPPWQRPRCLRGRNPRAEGQGCWAGPRAYRGSPGAQASRGARVPSLPGHPSLHVFLQRKKEAVVFQNWRMFFLLWLLFHFYFTHSNYACFVLVYTRGKLEMPAELVK